jgi:hypothetical protein
VLINQNSKLGINQVAHTEELLSPEGWKLVLCSCCFQKRVQIIVPDPPAH